MKYLITEKQNLNSYRSGTLVTAHSLRAAKIKARKMQYFYNTVLTIETAEFLKDCEENDIIDTTLFAHELTTVAICDKSGKWHAKAS